MPRVRVFLLTFRRPKLLERALGSLCRQTFADWVAEVHNGDPADPLPGEIVSRAGDPRLRLVLPPARTGPVEAFNLAHVPAPEPYQSILEDDNWWEPDFLARMLATLDAHPDVELAWSNMRVWQEEAGGQWRDTGQCVWNLPAAEPPRLFDWPQLLHFSDFLYSNGSMLLRSRSAARLILPPATPVDMIEHTRERQMAFPILLVPRPLANFSLTRRTFRSQNYAGWGETQALLGASFLTAVPMTPDAERELWAYRRSLRPRATNGLFFAALLGRKFSFLTHASTTDWRSFLAGCIRRPTVTWRILRARQRHQLLWQHLTAETRARTAEAHARGFRVLDAGTMLDKNAPRAAALLHAQPSAC